jgi:hypothetical protein
MESTTHIGAQVLAAEAQRYLTVVEAFRREGCEPRWVAEPTAPVRIADRPPAALMTGRQTC